jgi:hypothetical protein
MTDLSPAAAAVLKEYEDSWTADPFEMDIGALAGALRAAADQVNHHWDGMECVDYLCSIAAELEATE